MGELMLKKKYILITKGRSRLRKYYRPYSFFFFRIVPMARFCRVIILLRFLTVGGIGYKIRACKQLQVHVYIIELLSSSEASFGYVPLLAM